MMFRKLLVIAALTLSVSAASAGVDNVKGVTAPAAAPAAQSATETDAAVVSHGLTTATVTVPPSTEAKTYEIPTKAFIDAIMPYIVSAVGGIISVIGVLLATWLKQKWNIDIDQNHRDAWQQSAQNAAGSLLARGAVKIEDSGAITVKSEAMANAVNTVMQRVPQAIAHFGFTPNDIQNLIVAKIPQVISGAVPPTVAPAPDAVAAKA